MTTYRGFSTSGNEFASVSHTDFNLVKRDLMNNLNVRKGERVMRPDFGCVIWDMLFEPFTDDAHSTIVDNITELYFDLLNYGHMTQSKNHCSHLKSIIDLPSICQHPCTHVKSIKSL